jgi:hypothetical protein
MSILEGSVLAVFGTVFALALVLLGIVGQAVVRLYRHHALASGLFGAIALLWVLSITYNLRVLARVTGRDARLVSLSLIGEHVQHLRRAEQADLPLQRCFERFARWYPLYLVLFTALLGGAVIVGSLGM